ncbi:hypothetical protein [Campylobacter geochelonis]|uniref:hypothetical protein n=1 Tax=Campylobacter geochelonis TaxID=1780362 RepID=UPI000AD5C399|nr:hypothetical protein [Campylobacter geochelonis]
MVLLVWFCWFGFVGLVLLVWFCWFGFVGLVLLVWFCWFGFVGLVLKFLSEKLYNERSCESYKILFRNLYNKNV